MKKAWYIFLSILLIVACNNKNNAPDVSNINVNIKLERFEKSFFRIDTNNITPGLLKLRSEFPEFYNDFMQNILRVSGSENDSTTLSVTKMFLSSYLSFAEEISKKFSNTSGIEKDIRQGFQYLKYYFPAYTIPKLITYIGTLDAPGVAMTKMYVAIGLQQYAGRDFEGYDLPEVRQMFPAYIIRRFDPEYIPANCMKAIVEDMFPDKSPGKPLIEQMIEKGKQWWLLDKFMPRTADSLKTGYTQKQLDWCKENEGLIWNYFITSENLEAIDPEILQNYIGESPFTQNMPEASPGNIGPWVGWQIIKKFEDKNPSMKPVDIINMDARKILEEAKYKPK